MTGVIIGISASSKKNKDGDIIDKIIISMQADALKEALDFVKILNNGDHGILSFKKSQMSIDDKIKK